MKEAKHLPWMALILAVALTAPVEAHDIAEHVAVECGGCHDLTGPATDTLEARRERKGPPLFYAGNKFREDWLVAWLQAPQRIRPAGDFPPAHVTTGAKGDVIDAATLADHPALDQPTAEKVAAHLMTLRPNDDLIAQQDYTPGKISKRMGAMDFVKFKGCAACHRDTPELGGVSGPELHTAWLRLQSEFITSYISNPSAWDPRSIMPNPHLEPAPVHKLANYLRAIGEEGEKAK